MDQIDHLVPYLLHPWLLAVCFDVRRRRLGLRERRRFAAALDATDNLVDDRLRHHPDGVPEP